MGNLMNFKEIKRGAMYRSMKYWGKKPHNIWSDLIRLNTNKNDVVLDVFAGSGVAFFESILLKRKPIINDINPLTTFIIDVFSHSYNLGEIDKYYTKISDVIKGENLYEDYLITECTMCGQVTDIYNYRHEEDKLSVAYKCINCKNTIIDKVENLIGGVEYPKSNFPVYALSNMSSISQSTIDRFGGDDFKYLWTEINANILSRIFTLINDFPEPYKKIFVFAFIQMLHLTSKMCAIRGEKTNRILSSSWGRPSYMALSRYMSQNPLIQLHRSLYGNSGVIKAIKSKENRNLNYKYSNDLTKINEYDGIVLNKDSTKVTYYPVDFIITDPPYGDIIKYGELSLIWNLWLIEAYPSLKLNLTDEIIIDANKARLTYENKMNKVFENCYESLKQDGKMIFTFNSENTKDWESVKNILKENKFKITNFYLQENLRTSESSVRGKTSTSKSDYYIELSKESNLFSEYNLKMLEERIYN